MVSVIILIGMIGYMIWTGAGRDVPEVESLSTFQMADAPLFMPKEGEPQYRLHQLSAWDRASLPRAARFDHPMGTTHAALTYNAQKFWEMNESRGGHHTGDDVNGIGGMNTDLGDPIYSVGDGRVLYAGEPSSGWGKIVVVGHKMADGRMLHSMYAHLDKILVAVNTIVTRGQMIGHCGTGNNHYPAHLHFEMRESDGVDIGAGYTMVPMNRLDPSGTVERYRGASAEDISPSMLATALERAAPWNKFNLSPEDAMKLGELLDSSDRE